MLLTQIELWHLQGNFYQIASGRKRPGCRDKWNWDDGILERNKAHKSTFVMTAYAGLDTINPPRQSEWRQHQDHQYEECVAFMHCGPVFPWTVGVGGVQRQAISLKLTLNKSYISDYADCWTAVSVSNTGSSGLQGRQSSRQWLGAKMRRTTEEEWGRTGWRWDSERNTECYISELACWTTVQCTKPSVLCCG